MFVLAVTVCMNLEANSCMTMLSKQSFLNEDTCREFAMEKYPDILQSFPFVAALQCLPMPGESA